jgi:hypothetical protein
MAAVLRIRAYHWVCGMEKRLKLVDVILMHAFHILIPDFYPVFGLTHRDTMAGIVQEHPYDGFPQ